jgi:hypothetical protein
MPFGQNNLWQNVSLIGLLFSTVVIDFKMMPAESKSLVGKRRRCGGR